MNALSKLFLLLVFLFLPDGLHAQTPSQRATIQKFYEGYNARDYRRMNHSMGGLLKVIFREKLLRQSFGAMRDLMGTAEVVQWKPIGTASLKVGVAYQRDTTEVQYMNFHFSKKGKINGFGSKNEAMKILKDTTVSPSLPPEILQRRIDALVQYKHEKGSFNGCIAVVDNGRTVYENCYGYADMGTKTPLNNQTIFELASCSKQFTAMGIMLLKEQGKLAFSDLLSTYVPEMTVYPPITIEQLLTHTSGLPDYEELFESKWKDKTKPAFNSDVVSQLAAYHPKLLFKPGAKYEYCNTGYVMLAVIIEKVAGVSYQEFLKKNIFQPLSMERTQVYNTRRSGAAPPANFALGYLNLVEQKKYVIPDSLPDYQYVVYLDGIAGDGTVASSVADLLKWDKALRNNQLVKPETLQRAFSASHLADGSSFDYGYGWEVQRSDKYEPMVYHSGSWPGYITFMAHWLDKDRAVIMLTNNEYYFAGELATEIGNILRNKK